MICSRCEEECHIRKDCSGVKRSTAMKEREKGTWVCKKCKDPESYERNEIRKCAVGNDASMFLQVVNREYEEVKSEFYEFELVNRDGGKLHVLTL